MTKFTLRIEDEVNCKFIDLDPVSRRKIVDGLKYFVPHAKYQSAYRLGRWDGTVSYASVGGATFINLLDKVFPILIEQGYDLEHDMAIEDLRQQHTFNFNEIDEEVVADRCWPKGHPAEGEPIMLRDYQVDAINTFLKNPHGIQILPTGSGKTLTTATLSLQVEQYGRSLVIVPSKSLVVQTEADYKNMGMDVGVYFGERKELGHKHTVSTWQSLVSLIKQTVDGSKDESNDIFAMIEDVVCVITDEVHSAKADELKKMLCGVLSNIPLRWGFTGTLPKDEIAQVSILVGLGPVIGELKASKLQELGVLSKCQVNIVQLDDDHVEYTSYHEEYAFLTQDDRRLQWLANFSQKVTENGNTLILVQNIETGKKLNEMIPDSVFVYGETKNTERFEHFDDINTGTNKVLIASYGVAAVGINIPRIFNLVLFEPGKSFVRVIQSIGRGVRIAKDKDFVNIYDITSSLKYSTRHLSARKTFYREAEYPFETYQVKYLNNEFGELELTSKKKTKKKKGE
jgi:superfamily II DNA or RNA helicase